MNQAKSFPKQIEKRYLALDIIRGLTIALMILVNTPGNWEIRYAALKHAAWNGFTITDLVFPAFLFVIGNAMSFSMRKFESKSDGYFFKKIFSRFFKIFVIGLLLSLFPIVLREVNNISFNSFTEVSFTGVLQRIAITYLLAALILRFVKFERLIILSVIILLGYWGVLWFFGNSGDPYSLRGNAILKLDVWLYNLESGPDYVPFDTEALLSNLSAVVNILFGYIAGKFIQRSGNSMYTVWRLALVGLIFIGLGQVWDVWFPINKALWTSSYVVYSTGWILMVLALLIWILEIAGFRKWSYPLEIFGKNPLFIYVLSDALQELIYAIPIKDTVLQNYVFNSLFVSWLNPYNASLAFSIAYVILMGIVAYWMDKKKIYIKV